MSDTMRDSDLNELAKIYAASYASPHHITFTLDGLKNLIAQAAQSQPAPPAPASVQEIMRLIQPYVAACLKFNYMPMELIEQAEADVNAAFKPIEAALTALVDERDRLKFELDGVNAMRGPLMEGAEKIRSFSQLYEKHADSISAEHQKLRDEAITACCFEHDEFLVWKEDPSDKHSAWYVVLPTSTTVGSGDLISFNAHFDDAVDEARARFVAVACTRALRGLLNPHDDKSKQWQAGFAAGVDSVFTPPPTPGIEPEQGGNHG